MRPQDIQQYTKRLQELLDEGRAITTIAKPTKEPHIKTIQDGERLKAWEISVEHLVRLLFSHYEPFRLEKCLILLAKKTYYPSTVREICGLLKSILDDIKGGLLLRFEALTIGNISQDLLENVKQLNQNNHKDAAAMMLRVVVENSLKTLCQQTNVRPRSDRASDSNYALRDAGIYHQPQCTEVRSWLQTGNAAAHGDFHLYTEADITRIIPSVEAFIQQYLNNNPTVV